MRTASISLAVSNSIDRFFSVSPIYLDMTAPRSTLSRWDPPFILISVYIMKKKPKPGLLNKRLVRKNRHFASVIPRSRRALILMAYEPDGSIKSLSFKEKMK